MAVHEVITDKYVELIPYNGFTPAQIVARATQVGGYPKYDQSSSVGKVRASRSGFALIGSMMGFLPADENGKVDAGRMIRQRAGGNPSGTWSETESAFDNTTGVLKANELPRWNIFSGYTPGEWFLDNGALNFRFVRSGGRITNPLKDFAIFPHLFFGYNHAAQAPSFQASESFTATDGVVTVEFLVNIEEMQFPSTITHILAEIVIGANTQTVLMSLNDICNADLVQAQAVVFSGVASGTITGTITLFGSNSAANKVCTLSRVFTQKSFTISHTTAWNYISRLVGSSLDINVLVSGEMTLPAGSGNYPVYSGDNLSGVRLHITSSLMQGSYTNANFNLYLRGGEGGSRNIDCGSHSIVIGVDKDIDLTLITFSPALVGGETLAFEIESLTYY